MAEPQTDLVPVIVSVPSVRVSSVSIFVRIFNDILELYCVNLDASGNSYRRRYSAGK